MQYVAFLRGINVGGNKKVPMADLKKVLEKAGYERIKTLLASGNIIFESDEKNVVNVRSHLEEIIQKKFGFPVPVIVRTMSDLKKLKEQDPFKGIVVTPDTRLYVTFLSEKPKSKLRIPYESPGKEFCILHASDTEVISVLDVKTMGSVDAMAIVEKEFGKNVTTRNWNTIEKILA